MSIQVSLMTESDIDGAIDTIQQAFADDPYNKWLYPDRSKVSLSRNRHSLRLRCKFGIKHSLLHVARHPSSPKILGCAMWMPPSPPSAPQTWSHYLSTYTLSFSQLLMNLTYGRGGLSTKRYWIWKARQADAQSQIWTDPKGYYFCNIVTVLPEWQGKGVGRALMEEVLCMADREGVPCYLESSRRDPNVRIYEKFGFRLVKEMECGDGGEEEGRITLFCMVREPRAVVERRESESVET